MQSTPTHQHATAIDVDVVSASHHSAVFVPSFTDGEGAQAGMPNASGRDKSSFAPDRNWAVAIPDRSQGSP